MYFASNRTGRTEIWKMPVEGGEAVQITKNQGTSAFESPDGAYLYFAKQNPNVGPPGIWRMPIDGGEEELILEKVRWVDWTPSEKGIFYFNREVEPGAAIEFFDFATGDVSPVAALEHPNAFWGPSVSPDEQWILYVRFEVESDIMLVENFR
jgi:hypothetical protein